MIQSLIKNNEKIHDVVAKKYNARHVEIYNDVEQSRIGRVIANLTNTISKSQVKVLDYGAGTGNLTKFFLQEKRCFVTGLDISNKSLDILKNAYGDTNRLTIKKFDGYKIPFEDCYFDILSTYSVLHHIPDYMEALKDMVRVLKKGGLLYIDHEHNTNHRKPTIELKEYYSLYRTFFKKLIAIFTGGEIFELSFWKGIFIRLFINSRYANEGDIHVWDDDHIDRDNIISYLRGENFEIIENVDYLLYNPSVPLEKYNFYKSIANDTKYIVAQKK